jgi:hypothetical protein
MTSIWTSRLWREEVEAWIRDAVSAAGEHVIGPIEQTRVVMWSTHLTVPTTLGRLWFKENHPGQAAEAAVIDEIARIAPDHVVVPLRVERSRGWLLTPDHGATLDTVTGADAGTWSRVVAEFADLQRRVAGHRDALVTAGLVPLLPADAADHLEAQLERLRRLPPTDTAYVAPERAERTLQALPAVREIAERLAGTAPPLASLEHNDLHRSNVFIPAADESTLRFFDFGDSLWAHPFTTLFVPVSRLCQEWSTTPSDPRVRRVVDSYLDVWADQGSATDLLEAARLARQLGPLHRYESWRRLLEGSARAELPEEAANLEYWLDQIAAIAHPPPTIRPP